MSGSMREQTPKLMQPSSTLILLIQRERQTERINKQDKNQLIPLSKADVSSYPPKVLNPADLTTNTN